MLANWRFFKSLIGKIGSCADASFRSRYTSQTTNPTQSTADSARDATMAPLSHAYRAPPPDSSAKTSSTDAASRAPAPKRSTRRIAARENLARSLAARAVCCPSALLAGRKEAMSAMATRPGGPLQPGQPYVRALEPVGEQTCLRRNTQRQLALLAIAPPTSGPAMLAMAKTDEMMPMYLPYSVTGTRAGAITSTME